MEFRPSSIAGALSISHNEPALTFPKLRRMAKFCDNPQMRQGAGKAKQLRL
jgi:hypothetical protein